jgi:putative ABC transport system permease protein
MINHFFKISWRNISRNKIFTLINIAGLALSTCACMVIFLIASHELSFDTFHADKERIYHVGEKERLTTGILSRIPSPMAAALIQEVSGIEAVASFYPYDASIIIPGNGQRPSIFYSGIEGSDQTSVIITDPHYFDIFNYEWLAGKPATSLERPLTVVLSASKALRYFGSLPYDQIMGREIIYNDSLRVTVSGIVKDWNKNTDFPFTEFISYRSINACNFLRATYKTDEWKVPGIWCMVKLSKNIESSQITRQLIDFSKRHMSGNPDKIKFMLQPLSDVHFNADYSHDDIRKADLPTIRVLIGIALFILALAIINFINLSTAQSMQRIKEIGVRKILGSTRAGLGFQFVTETAIISFFSICAALLMTGPAISIFQDFIPPGITFRLLNKDTLYFLLILFIAIPLLAGFYPAKVLSSYLPAVSLRGIEGQSKGKRWLLRRGLVIFQFTISLIFIIGTLIISRQMSFVLEADYGLKTGGILDVFVPRWEDNNHWTKSKSKWDVLAEKIKNLPGVKKVIEQGSPPTGWVTHFGEISFAGKNRQVRNMKIQIDNGNEEFIPFYHMRLLSGRNLSTSDSLQEFIINETCLKNLGFTRPEDALGQFVNYQNQSFPIVGVIRDFHEGSFHNPIEPLIIGHDPGGERDLGIQLVTKDNQAGNIIAELSVIEKVFKQIYPKNEFNCRVIDDCIPLFYDSDQKTSKLISAATLIAVFISCIGLFGLSMYNAKTRTKEIGIRKVIGASVSDIIALFTKDYVVLIMLAFLIASPLAWFFSNKWLENFAYKINISYWIFLFAMMIAVTIAFATISFQAIKAASANPVKSLRAE